MATRSARIATPVVLVEDANQQTQQEKDARTQEDEAESELLAATSKLVFVLLGGIVFFGGDTNPKRLFGMFLTFCGVVWYGHLKLTQASSQENWDKGSKAESGGAEKAAEEVPMVQK